MDGRGYEACLVADKYNALITAAEEATAPASFNAGKGAGGPLSGLRYAVKDNIAVSGIRLTCASKMLADFVPDYDADCVSALKRSGAAMIGKANMDEFSMGSSGEYSAFGRVKNPYDPDRVAGGSSAGCAALVAAGICDFAIGSDTGGSVRAPASFCGIAGIKPTYGRISRFGLVTFASSLDCVGIMSGSVTCGAKDLEIISGKSSNDDSQSRFIPDGKTEEILKYRFDPAAIDRYDPEKTDALSGTRIAVIEDVIEAAHPDGEVTASFREILRKLEKYGAYVEYVAFPEISGALEAYYVISSSECYSNLARFDGFRYGLGSEQGNGRVSNSSMDHGERKDGPVDFDSFVRSNRENGFGPEVRARLSYGSYLLSEGSRRDEYAKAEKLRREICGKYREIFGKFDAIASPAMPSAAFLAGEKRDPASMHAQDVLTVCANLTGVPAVCVPMGKNAGGLPLGLQFEGNYFDENTVFALARFVEKISGFSGVDR